MPLLQKRIALDAGGSFEVQVINNQGQLWLRLSRPSDVDRHLGLWSAKPDVLERVSYQEIIEQLQTRLADPETTPNNLHRRVQLWPRGWEYGGRGKPEQLLDYFDWTFGREMEMTTVDSE